MPVPPNAPATDEGYTATLLGPDTTPEDQMTITNGPLDVEGSYSTRVDCNCNAYAKETVTIPNVVIYDALLGLQEGDNARTVLARTMGDQRITAAKTANPDDRRPGPDFTVSHLAQAAATLRNRKLIPFTPFASNAWHLTQTRAVFGVWRDRYLDELNDVDGVDLVEPEASEAPLETIAVGPEGITGVEEVQVVQSGPDVTGQHLEAGTVLPVADLPPAPGLPDVGAGYPDPPAAKEVIAWIGDDYLRAMHAWSVELGRGGDIRKTVRDHCDALGVDVG